jgi:hypothetical protein
MVDPLSSPGRTREPRRNVLAVGGQPLLQQIGAPLVHLRQPRRIFRAPGAATAGGHRRGLGCELHFFFIFSCLFLFFLACSIF